MASWDPVPKENEQEVPAFVDSVEDYLAIAPTPVGQPKFQWKFVVTGSKAVWKSGCVHAELTFQNASITAFSGGQGLLNVQGDVDRISFAGLFQCANEPSSAVLSAPELIHGCCPGRSVIVLVSGAEFDRMRKLLRFFVQIPEGEDAGLLQGEGCRASLTRPSLCFDGVGVDPWQQLARETLDPIVARSGPRASSERR